jgi:hypothetical protein
MPATALVTALVTALAHSPGRPGSDLLALPMILVVLIHQRLAVQAHQDWLVPMAGVSGG